MNLLELHLYPQPGTDIIKYQIGFFDQSEFVTIGKGACNDKEYILEKISSTYGHVPVFENEELLSA
jgi:hypothetical protein